MTDAGHAAESAEPFPADGPEGDSRGPSARPLGREAEGDDARVVIDFGVGPPGVGPVVGVGSGEFFPVVSDAADPGTVQHDLA